MHLRLILVLVLPLLFALPASGSAANWYISADGLGDAPTIQAAVDLAANGDSIILAAGTYAGIGNRDVDLSGKDIVITSASGPEVTIINCDHVARAFLIVRNEGPSCVISGLKIIRGNAPFGGAIYVRTAQPTITGNIFNNCHSQGDGGAILYDVSFGGPPPVLIADNVFTNNTAVDQGGAILFASDNTTLTGNYFENNEAETGGAIYVNQLASGVVSDNTINANTANFAGGGVYDDCNAVSHDGNIISNNVADFDGGGMHINHSDEVFENLLLVDNDVTFWGSAIYCGSNARPTIRACTVVENTGGPAIVTNGDQPVVDRTIVAFNAGLAFECFNGGMIKLSCSNIFGNTGVGTCITDLGNNFYTDPFFCDPLFGDYRVTSLSQCDASNSPCGQQVGAFGTCPSPTGIGDDLPSIGTALHQNSPNPFNPTTTIDYQLRSAGAVLLEVFDVRGMRIRVLVNEHQTAGRHRAVWDGRDGRGRSASSGVYFYRLSADGLEYSRKMMLLK